jgi:hypothetical protein
MFTSQVPSHVDFKTVDVPLKYLLGIWQLHDHVARRPLPCSEQSLHVSP